MIIETKQDHTHTFDFGKPKRPRHIFKRGHRMLVLGKLTHPGAGIVETTFYFVLPFGMTNPVVIWDNSLTRPFYNLFSIVC